MSLLNYTPSLGGSPDITHNAISISIAISTISYLPASTPN
jgi:hypothetical protein